MRPLGKGQKRMSGAGTSELIKADICVIGGGSAGLSVAAGASQMGAKTVLIEKHRMGGDCLNTGCIPSKSLLAAANATQAVRDAHQFGVRPLQPEVDFAAVIRRVHDVIASIAPHDSVERFTGLGCRVINAHARFVDRYTIAAGSVTIRARRFVIATGSRPVIPSIPGLETLDYFTNETIFDNSVLPEHLIVIGAGPVGCEMAQAHRRLGARVTLIEVGTILAKDDLEAVDVIRQSFKDEGIGLVENAKVTAVERSATGVAVKITVAGLARQIEGTHLLLAAGRQPNVDGIGLEAAGVQFDAKGIAVDARLRTTNKRIFAAGDVVGGPLFTHAAGYHAGIIVRNALFRIPAKTSYAAFPRVTYTVPELAQVGLTEAEARAEHGASVKVECAHFAQNDRAQADGTPAGFLKAIVGKRGRILGATIVGSHAGELALPWVLTVSKRHTVGDIAGLIAPYPTLSEISKRASGNYFTPTLYSARVRRLVRILGVFG